MDVINRAALTDRFGGWPSFHDAEVYGLRLESGQRSSGVAALALEIHVFAIDGRLPDGRLNFVNHSLVTLGFEEIEELEMDGFGPQNVLDDLLLEEVHQAAGRQIQVTLPSNNGLEASFRCRSVTVLDVSDLEPGPHSVYGR